MSALFTRFFSRPDAFEITAMTTADAAIAARLHKLAFARGWTDGEFASLLVQPAVFGFLAVDPVRARDLAADNRVVERLRLSRGQEAIDTVAHEHLILEAHEEPRLAGVALSPRLATAGRRGDSRGDSCR